MGKKSVGVIVSVVVLALIIGLAIWKGGSWTKKPGPNDSATQNLTIVRGLIGSEKKPFFDDPRVKEEFRKRGYDVRVDTAGSRAQMNADPKAYDFFFPGSAPVADELAAKVKGKKYAAFYSPLVIYSYTSVVDVLKQNGVVNGTNFDVKAYMDMVGKGTRWADLKGIQPPFNTPKAVLVTTTNPASSNSALMFASLAAYVANGNNVVMSSADVAKVKPAVKPLFASQGYTESSSEGPFEDYLALGPGKTPLLVGYESQLLARMIAKDSAVTKEMVILTPNPGMISKHTLVSTTSAGEQIGELLTNDPELGKLIATYGFRTANASIFNDVVSQAGITAPAISPALADPSPYAILDEIVAAIQS